ncbi:hypothetical protein BpHYR1_048437 [Brachionus plicatilis]|uniref:Uncharacterized protein n=1 Tax=Brachionus plicatilis TaxID=10195 RepID=A0A3M7SSC8_BRAPC|nr:hypothetical protein BpHYR1_048437 [Brachionus plicatilis]
MSIINNYLVNFNKIIRSTGEKKKKKSSWYGKHCDRNEFKFKYTNLLTKSVWIDKSVLTVPRRANSKALIIITKRPFDTTIQKQTKLSQPQKNI